jgi:hypothetical protein
MKRCKNCRWYKEYREMTCFIRAIAGMKPLTKENYPHCFDCEGLGDPLDNWESRFPWMRIWRSK